MFCLFGASAGPPAAGWFRALEPWYGFLLGTTALFVLVAFVSWLTMRHIPNNKIGVIEKLWSSSGSVPEGRIIALSSEAGFQSELLRGGIHFGYWRWQYVVHKAPLVSVPQGKIAYVYARDGEPLPPSQTLARVVPCTNFQDARRFLVANSQGLRGQRGRQRAILREGVYAINPALFVVITENTVYTLADVHDPMEKAMAGSWRTELVEQNGFDPVVVGAPIETADPVVVDGTIFVDGIGLVTVHDGPSLRPGEIIAPSVGDHVGDPHYHNNFQIPESFLDAGI